MNYDWLMVAFNGNYPSIITNASYPNDPRGPSAENWCAIFLIEVHKYNQELSLSLLYYREIGRRNHQKLLKQRNIQTKEIKF